MALKIVLKHVLTIALLVSNGILWAADTTESANTAKFLSVADIHFDPFYGCSKHCVLLDKLRTESYQEWPGIFDQYGDKTISSIYHDTNYPLLKSSLVKLQEIAKKDNPKFVLILGDFLAHDFRQKYIKYCGDKTHEGYQAFVKKTLQFLTSEYAHEFPDIDVYPVVGNNDSYTGDYSTIPYGKFYQDAADFWSVLIKDKTNRENFQKEFPAAGYYEVTLPTNKNQRIIVLNTVLFSSHIHSAKIQAAALQELDWLHQQLQDAEKHHQQVFIADHIPIGIDAFATIISRFSIIQQFWQPIYTTRFEKELDLYPAVVTAIFSGHIHADAFQIITLKKVEEIPVYFTPSISPIYGNNPGFKVFSYDLNTLKITDPETYFYPLDQTGTFEWRED